MARQIGRNKLIGMGAIVLLIIVVLSWLQHKLDVLFGQV